jgi:hypothetical protein
VLSFILLAAMAGSAEAPADPPSLELVVHDREGSDRNGVVTGGVPLPAGFCVDPRRLALRSGAEASQVPLQATTLSRWPDGSIRWALLSFFSDAATPHRGSVLTVDAEGDAPAPATPLTVGEADGGTLIDCGPLRLEFRDGQTGLWNDLWLHHEGRWVRPLAGGGPTLSIITDDGAEQVVFPVASSISVEEAGPLRAVVKVARSVPLADGDVDFFARIYCHAGQPWIRVDITVVNCSDPGDVAYRSEVLRPQRGVKRVRGMPLSFRLADWVGSEVVYGETPPREIRSADADGFRTSGLRQQSASSFLVRHGDACRCHAGQAAGWARVGPLQFAVREFWQQFPKSLSYDPDSRTFTLDLCDTNEDEPFLFNPGVAKTHQIAIDGGDGSGSGLVASPLRASLSAAALRDSGAITPFGRVDRQAWPIFEALAEESAVAWLSRAANGRSPGILHYGDPGGNGYHHPDHDLMLHGFRSGRFDLLDVASAQARHRADIDIMHHPQELRGWHHTEYSDDHWDPRSGSIKEWIAGLYDEYCLTGDRRALQALEEVGDWIVRARPRDASRNAALPLGWMAQIALATDTPAHWQELRDLYAHLREVALSDTYADRMFSVGHLVDGLYRYWITSGDDSAIPAIVQASSWFYRQTGSPSGTIPSTFERESCGIYYWAPGEIVSVAAQAYAVTGDAALLRDGLGAFDSYLHWYGPVVGWPLGAGAGMHQMQWACQQEGITEEGIAVEPWGGFAAAEGWLRDRLGRGGDDDSLTIELARTLTNARRYDDARAAVAQRRATKQPGDRFWPELTHALAYISLRQGDWESARTGYAELLAGLQAAADPEAPPPIAAMTARWGQAVCFEQLGDRAAAAAAYDECARAGSAGRAVTAGERAGALRGR